MPCSQQQRAAALGALAALLAPAAVRGEGAGLRGDAAGTAGRQDRGRTRYVAHFMPWFEGSPSRSFHWCSPEHGNSYYASVLGRYDSSDPAIYRKQLGLMKAAGLDGLWINLQLSAWLPRVRSIAEEAGRAGLRVAVVVDTYNEERILDVLGGPIAELMRMPNYYKIDDRPVLPIFEHPEIWALRPTVLPTWDVDGKRPFVIGTFMHHSDEGAPLPRGYDSLFFWQSPDLSWMERGYYNSSRFSVKVGSVFRGWREAYKHLHHHPPYLGYLESTLRLARKYTPEFAQVVTWNDYTEGTMLEPSFLRAGTGCGVDGGPHLRDVYWYNRSATCESLQRSSGACHLFAGGMSCTAAAAASGAPCCGSGGAPCADIEDCSKPFGAAQGPGAPACRRRGKAFLSAYAELAAVARALRGISEAEATTEFVDVVFGRKGQAEEVKEGGGGAPGPVSAKAPQVSVAFPWFYVLLGLVLGMAVVAALLVGAACGIFGKQKKLGSLPS